MGADQMFKIVYFNKNSILENTVNSKHILVLYSLQKKKILDVSIQKFIKKKYNTNDFSGVSVFGLHEFKIIPQNY